MQTIFDPWVLVQLFLFPLLVLIGGIVVLRRGMRVRRRGDEPFCPQCDYSLTGLQPGVCPECGGAWTEQTLVRGRPYRRRGLIVAGAVLCVLSLGGLNFAWKQVPPVDLYRWAPAWWVLRDVGSSSTATHWRGVREFQRRILAKSVSVEQIERFLDKVTVATLKIPPTVVKGERVPFEARLEMPNVHALTPVVVEQHYRVDAGPGGTRGLPTGGFGSRIYSGTLATDSLAPGKHTMWFQYRVRYYMGGFALDVPQTLPSFERDVTLQAEFEVLPAEAPESIRRADAAPARGVQKHIQVKGIRIESCRASGDTEHVEGMLEVDVKSWHMPIAFRILLRADGVDHFLNNWKLDEEENIKCLLFFCADLPAGTVEKGTARVVLQGTTLPAPNVLDSIELWDGELVYPDVPVAAQAPLQPPGLPPAALPVAGEAVR